MSVLDELSRRQNTMVWLLEIDGLQKTYYSSPTAPTLPPYAEAWTHTAAPGIMAVTSADQELDVLQSVVTAGQVSVTLAVTRDNDARLLMAVGRDGSPHMATLASTLDQTGGGLVEVNEDISGWPAAGYLWIGKECIQYSARSVASPWQFTIALATDRGWWGSEQRMHIASSVEGWAPRIYSQCVTWQNRKARVLVSSLRPDGSQADGWVEYVSGRIVSNPEISGDGLSVALNIIPHTDALSISVGGGVERTGLQQGLHTFDGQSGGTFMCAVGYSQGEAWSDDTGFNAAANTELKIKWAAHNGTFDLAAVTTIGGANPDYQRRGRVVDEDGTEAAQDVTAYVGLPDGDAIGDELTLSPGTVFVTPRRKTWQNAAASNNISASVLTAPGVPEVIQWPGVALARLTALMSPHDHRDTPLQLGQFADVILDPNHASGGPVVQFRFNTARPAGAFVKITAWDASGEALYYGASGFASDAATKVWMLETQQHANVGAIVIRRESGALGNAQVLWEQAAADGSLIVPVRGYPDAYYQRGESWIHITDNVIRGSRILVRWTEWDGEEYRQSIAIDESGTQAADLITPGQPGTLLKIDTDQDRWNMSFGDWPGQSKCTIEEDVSWRNTGPKTVLLNVLMSGDGNGYNSTFDVFAMGANLRQDEVDIQSFVRYPYPDGFAQRLTLSLNDWDSITIREFVEPILRSIGAALVLRVERVAAAGAGGVLRRRLTLVSVSSEYAGDAIGTIANGDWLANSRPDTTDDDRIVNIIRASTGYDSAADEYSTIVNLVNRDSIGEYGSAPTDELDLRGVTIPPGSPADHLASLLPFSAARFAQVGAPRRQIEGAIAWADAVQINAGTTVMVSAVDIYGYDGARGISAQPMRVISINGDGYKQTARIKLTWHDSTVSGWSPSLMVAAVTNASTYTVEANIYTETTDPVSGLALEDVDYWQAGDSIRACPRGSYGTSTGGLTVLSIVGNLVTLSGPAVPALNVGDTLRPDGYAQPATTTTQQAYAYLGDDAGGLGAVPDPAKLYA